MTLPRPYARVPRFDLALPSGTPFYVSLLSDLHLDSSCCDIEGLRSLLAKRAKLPNHRAVIFGDVLDLIGPRDMKRYRRGIQQPRLETRDDWVNELIDFAVEVLSVPGLKIDLITRGNHEDEWLKRHSFDVLSVIGHKLGAAVSGYSGVVDYRVKIGKKNRGRFRLAWHHGAWGGRYAKGYIGAVYYGMRIQGWDVFAYGHSHQSRADAEVVMDVSGGKLVERVVYMVNCASWTRAMDPKSGRQTHYAERRGLVPQPRVSPLIKVVPVMCAGTIRMETSIEIGA